MLEQSASRFWIGTCLALMASRVMAAGAVLEGPWGHLCLCNHILGGKTTDVASDFVLPCPL